MCYFKLWVVSYISEAPGPFYTPLQPASRPPEQMEVCNLFLTNGKNLKPSQGWEIGKIPLHGRAGQPAEIAEVYVLLAGPGGNYMTGQ